MIYELEISTHKNECVTQILFTFCMPEKEKTLFDLKV